MRIETQSEGLEICVECPTGIKKMMIQVKEDIEAAEFTTEVTAPMDSGQFNDDGTRGYYQERMIEGEELTKEKVKSIADGNPYTFQVKYTRNVGEYPEANVLILIENEVLI